MILKVGKLEQMIKFRKKMGRIVVCLFLEVKWKTLLKRVLKASDST